MKNRVPDPVKMIQLLPVDNGLSKQPLIPPPDFSAFIKKLIQAFRQPAAWMMKTGHQLKSILQRNRALDQLTTPVEEDRGQAHTGPAQESSTSPLQWTDTDPVRPAPVWADRPPDIVVNDLVVLQRQPSLPITTDPANLIADHIDDDARTPRLVDVRRRVETVKAAIVAQWLREKEQIGSIMTPTRAKLPLYLERMQQSFRAARIEFLHQCGAIARFVRKYAGRMFTRLQAVADQREEKGQTQWTAARDLAQNLTHELEVTKATLLAQQQALENVAVQLSAVQKELARHKNLLAGLMSQVDALDLKIVGAAQTPAPRKSKATTEAGQPKRASTKKDLTDERSREQRV